MLPMSVYNLINIINAPLCKILFSLSLVRRAQQHRNEDDGTSLRIVFIRAGLLLSFWNIYNSATWSLNTSERAGVPKFQVVAAVANALPGDEWLRKETPEMLNTGPVPTVVYYI